MQFEKGHLYHIYNQGNNRQKIFFERENYLFFLNKIRTSILPYADILAWCLMPNHFHLMVLVNEVEVYKNEGKSRDATLSRGVTLSRGATLSRTPTDSTPTDSTPTGSEKTISLNHSIGIMLASYTRAINKQQELSGSLFRSKTKAECIDCLNKITPSFMENKIIINNAEKQYPQICFDYIHNNPVKAKMVIDATDYEFSSAQDYTDIRNGRLINKVIAKKYVDY